SIVNGFDRVLDGFLDGIMGFVVIIIRTAMVVLGVMLIIRFYNRNMFKRKNKSKKGSSIKKRL
ncbi:MAG: hypothetical protein RR048_04385, partial [Oscillospiraceae bacterium]